MQCQRQINSTASAREIVLVCVFDLRDVQLERMPHGLGQNRHPLAQAFAITNDDVTVAKIDVLDAQSQAFEQTQAAAVEQLGHEPILAV